MRYFKSHDRYVRDPRLSYRTRRFILALWLLLGAAIGSGSVATGADGDPNIGVPTIRQGRAILARDMLWSAGAIALNKKDWAALKEHAVAAVEQEKAAFGEDFPGTSLTQALLIMSHVNLGEFDVVRRLLALYHDQTLPAFDASSGEGPETSEALERGKLNQLEMEFAVKVAVARIHGNPEAVDRDVDEFYDRLPPHNEHLPPSPDTAAGTSDAKDPVAHNSPVLELLYSQSQLRKSNYVRALRSGWLAYHGVRAANPDGWSKDRLMFGGVETAEHLLSMLKSEVARAVEDDRLADALQAIQQVEAIATEIGADTAATTRELTRLQRLLELPPESRQELKQADVMEKEMHSRSEFDATIALGSRVLEIRTRLLGEDADSAAVHNWLGYQLWTKGRYAEAFSYKRAAAIDALKNRPSDDILFKMAVVDTYINAQEAAAAASPPADLYEPLRTLVSAIEAKHGVGNPSAAAGRLALDTVRRRLEVPLEHRVQLAELGKLKSQRNTAYSRGDFNVAAETAKKVVDLATTLLGEDDEDVIDGLRAYSNCLSRLGNSSEALQISERMVAVADRAPRNTTVGFVWILTSYVGSLTNVGNQQKALEVIRRAKNLARQVDGAGGSYADSLRTEGEVLGSLNQTAAARAVLLEAKQVYEANGNGKSWVYCQVLVQLGLCDTNLAQHAQATQHLQQSLKIRLESSFSDPQSHAWNLWALGQSTFEQLKFAESAEYHKSALEIKETNYPAAGDVPSMYGAVIRSYSWAGNSNEAEKWLNRFRDRRGQFCGRNSPAFAREMRVVAEKLLHGPGSFFFSGVDATRAAAAVQLSRDAAAILGAQSDVDPLEIAYLVQLQADALMLSGDHKAAVPLYQSVFDRISNNGGQLQFKFGTVNVGLARAYEDQGAVDLALHHVRLAELAFHESSGAKSLFVATSLMQQGRLLSKIGDFDEAERAIVSGADIFRLAGNVEATHAYALLASLYLRMGDFDRAEQNIHFARSLSTASSGDSIDPGLLFLLARLHVARGEYDLARPIVERIVETTASPYAAAARDLLGQVCLASGEIDAAAELFLEAIDIRDEQIGKDHIEHLAYATRTFLARAYESRGEIDAAAHQLREQLRLADRVLAQLGGVLSERQQLALREYSSSGLYSFLTFATNHNLDARDIYAAVFAKKGAVFERQLHLRLRMKDADATTRELCDQLAAVSRQLAHAAFSTTAGPDRQRSLSTLQTLVTQRERIEARLAGMLPQGGGIADNAAMGELQLDDLLGQLKADEVLLDYVEYDHQEIVGDSQRRMLCFVVRKDAVRLVALGSSSPITDLIHRWRGALGPVLTAEFAELNRRVSAAVWEPLVPFMASPRRVLVSPDGGIAQLAFAALPLSAAGGYLVEQIQFVSVPAPRLLVQLERAHQPPADAGPGRVLLLGSVDYDGGENISDANANPILAANDRSTVRWAARSLGSQGQWSELPGTLDELNALERIASETAQEMTVVRLTGVEANETQLRRHVAGKRWLHFATHGFFANSPAESAVTGTASASNAALGFGPDGQHVVTGFDPSLLSGIVLANANAPLRTGVDDGILTAAEIAELDLSDSELTVLSACESALGKIHSGEGVLGLQRSFHIAGCPSVVATLWKVDDQATAATMDAFYRGLWADGLPPADALREAQLAMIAGYDVTTSTLRGDRRVIAKTRPGQSEQAGLSPFYWAAFTYSGY